MPIHLPFPLPTSLPPEMGPSPGKSHGGKHLVVTPKIKEICQQLQEIEVRIALLGEGSGIQNELFEGLRRGVWIKFKEKTLAKSVSAFGKILGRLPHGEEGDSVPHTNREIETYENWVHLPYQLAFFRIPEVLRLRLQIGNENATAVQVPKRTQEFLKSLQKSFRDQLKSQEVRLGAEPWAFPGGKKVAIEVAHFIEKNLQFIEKVLVHMVGGPWIDQNQEKLTVSILSHNDFRIGAENRHWGKRLRRSITCLYFLQDSVSGDIRFSLRDFYKKYKGEYDHKVATSHFAKIAKELKQAIPGVQIAKLRGQTRIVSGVKIESALSDEDLEGWVDMFRIEANHCFPVREAYS